MTKICVKKKGTRWHRLWIGVGRKVGDVIKECQARGFDYKLGIA